MVLAGSTSRHMIRCMSMVVHSHDGDCVQVTRSGKYVDLRLDFIVSSNHRYSLLNTVVAWRCGNVGSTVAPKRFRLCDAMESNSEQLLSITDAAPE